MQTNLDKIKSMPTEELISIFVYKNICPYTFGGNRRGKDGTCPYPRMRPEDCKNCWNEWLSMKVGE